MTTYVDGYYVEGFYTSTTSEGDDTATSGEALLTHPPSAISATGFREPEQSATLTQPGSEVSGVSGWGHITLDQPASALEIEGTNPPVGRADLVQPRARLEATGLVGRVGRATLDQPASTIAGVSGWQALLDSPGTRIEATGLAGRVGRATLDQPSSTIEAQGDVSGVGRADLVQPRSDLVPVTIIELVSPRSTLMAAGRAEEDDTAEKAYVINYATGAVTEYPEFAFTEIHRFMGEYYALGPGGLYRLDEAAGDDGEAIASRIECAQQDFGQGMLSRATACYFFIDSKEAFDAVMSTGEGYRILLRLQQRDGEGAHTRRMKGPRGVKARTWGTGLENQGTAPFRVYGVEMIGEVLRRRV